MDFVSRRNDPAVDTGFDGRRWDCLSSGRLPRWTGFGGKEMQTHRIMQATISGALLLGLLASSTGCQVSVGGQTLPSPYYLLDDVQYDPAGPEFKLSREAAALEAARAQEKARLKP